MRRRRFPDSHDGHFGFCPAKSQLYRVVVKPPHEQGGIACILLLADGQRPVNRRSPARRMQPISLRTPLALLLMSLGAIAAVWWWLRTPITLARAPIDPNAKLLCVSYAPFRDAQTPLVQTTHIAPEQIAQDLAQLAKISDCVRTYSIENGLDQVPALAAKVGLKVIHGLWLGSNPLKNLPQISTVVRLPNEYPTVITAAGARTALFPPAEITTPALPPT